MRKAVILISEKKTKAVTLKEVALEAGVSVMAVSKVLNHKGGISAETSQRILEAAKRLKYRPNTIAQSLRASKTHTLGVVVSDSSQLVFSKVLRGIEDAAAKAGYSVLISNTDSKSETEKRAVDVLLGKRIDGLILAAPLNTGVEDMEYLKEFGVPFVILMRDSALPEIDTVRNDNESGGCEILRYLLNRDPDGALFFLNIPERSQSGKARINGYKKALSEQGRQYDSCRCESVLPSVDSGYEAMNRILSDGIRSGNICCGCDLIAIGAIKAILEAGFSVPQDFRVTGYDDIDLADCLRVPLTTIRQPKYRIGQLGAELLLRKIDSRDTPAEHIVLHSELIVRDSA